MSYVLCSTEMVAKDEYKSLGVKYSKMWRPCANQEIEGCCVIKYPFVVI